MLATENSPAEADSSGSFDDGVAVLGGHGVCHRDPQAVVQPLPQHWGGRGPLRQRRRQQQPQQEEELGPQGHGRGAALETGGVLAAATH